jgi:hypothetical protein
MKEPEETKKKNREISLLLEKVRFLLYQMKKLNKF